MSPLVQGRGLQITFGATPVLRGADLSVDAGEIVAVVGSSGSGKSTLLHVLAGLLPVDAGEVHFDGMRTDTLPERRRSALRLSRMGFVFQFGDLVPELTLQENVELPLRLSGSGRAAARSRALDVLAELGVADVAGRRVDEVSGGQAQRAAVARALVHEPAVIFADEPTGSLDTVTGELVLEALVGAARERSAAVVLVTHELRVAAYADREVVMRDGALSGATHLPTSDTSRRRAPVMAAGERDDT